MRRWLRFDLYGCCIIMDTVQMMTTTTTTSTIDDINLRLRQAGMRSTLPRRAVLEAIAASAEHLTADEIGRTLVDRGVQLPRSSVNNILGRLALAGLIGRVDTLPGATRFERDTVAHHHFWCTSCRRAFNVPAQPLEPPTVAGRVETSAVTYGGKCTACVATTARNERTATE